MLKIRLYRLFFLGSPSSISIEMYRCQIYFTANSQARKSMWENVLISVGIYVYVVAVPLKFSVWLCFGCHQNIWKAFRLFNHFSAPISFLSIFVFVCMSFSCVRWTFFVLLYAWVGIARGFNMSTLRLSYYFDGCHELLIFFFFSLFVSEIIWQRQWKIWYRQIDHIFETQRAELRLSAFILAVLFFGLSIRMDMDKCSIHSASKRKRKKENEIDLLAEVLKWKQSSKVTFLIEDFITRTCTFWHGIRFSFHANFHRIF